MTKEFDRKHDDPKDSQLIMCITGTPEHIKEALEDALKRIEEERKPLQGIFLSNSGTTEVQTPIWWATHY